MLTNIDKNVWVLIKSMERRLFAIESVCLKFVLTTENLNVAILATECCLGRKTSLANGKITFVFHTIFILTPPAITIFKLFISCPKQTILQMRRFKFRGKRRKFLKC